MAEQPPDPRFLDSGLEVEPVYRSTDTPSTEPQPPGEFPFTRGPYADMYGASRGRSASTPASRRRRSQRALPLPAARGQTGLSIAFDLPTQLGFDRMTPWPRARWADRRRGRLDRRHGGAAERTAAR